MSSELTFISEFVDVLSYSHPFNLCASLAFDFREDARAKIGWSAWAVHITWSQCTVCLGLAHAYTGTGMKAVTELKC